MKSRKVYIRADGNSEIGVGHQMRCLSIADALREFGSEVVFLTADESGSVLPESRGYACEVLNTDYRAPEQEISKVRELLRNKTAAAECGRSMTECKKPTSGCKKPTLILDSYAIRPSYLEKLRKDAFIVYLDDYGKEYFPADCIINYNIYGPDMPYDELYATEKTGNEKPLLLLGSEYAPLRKAFLHPTHIAKKEVTDVLITTGGADWYNVAGQLVELLTRKADNRTKDAAKQNTIRYHVVSGAFHTSRETLERLAAERNNIVIHENVTGMAELMARCDLAVSAAGSTLYELCAVQVPTVYFYFVENQRLAAKCFAEKTDMICCGNFADEPEETLQKLFLSVRELEEKQERRAEIAESMKNVTDGSGAERIAKWLNES